MAVLLLVVEAAASAATTSAFLPLLGSILSYGLMIVGIVWLLLTWMVHRSTAGIVHAKTKAPMPSASFFGELFTFLSFIFKKDVDLIEYVLKKKEQLGNTFIFWQGWRSMVIISEVEDLKQVLLCKDETFAKEDVFADNATLDRIFGTSLVAVTGDQWKQQRKGMDPAFKHKRLKDLMPTFNTCAQRLITYWENQLAASPGQPIPVYNGISKMTLDAIGLAGFSHDFKALEEKFDESLHAYETVSASILNPLLVLFPWLGKLPLPSAIKLNRAFTEMDALLYRIINNHIEQEKAGKADSDVLAHILALRATNMSDREMRDNLFLFFVAGHDTSSSALTSALYFLSLYPDLQKRAQEEVDAVLDGRTEVEYDDLRKLEYVGRVLKETLRVKPPVDATTSRTVTRDGIVLGGYHLPKGTQVVPSISLANYDEKAWPEPHKFDPDRWEHPSADAISFLSFSAGPRVCIGKNFAMMEMTVALSRILQRFEVSLIPNYEWKTKLVSIAHTPLDNLPLLFKLRS